MAFPTQREMLSVGLARAQGQASSIKRIAQNNNARMAAGNITADGLLSLLDNLKGAVTTFQDVRALPGIGSYATAQLGEDVSADFTAMENAATAAASLIITQFPQDGDGYLLIQQINAQGDRTEREFTPAQTAGLRAALDTLIATID